MAVKQQFIIEVGNATLLDLQDLVDGGDLQILLKSRETAEALYADLSEALGYGTHITDQYFGAPQAPVQVPYSQVVVNAPRITDAQQAELEAFFSEDEPTPIVPVRTPEQLSDAELAASQALTRREIQAQDPENKASFTPHVGYTVPPTEKRGSSIGAIHLPQ